MEFQVPLFQIIIISEMFTRTVFNTTVHHDILSSINGCSISLTTNSITLTV